MRYEIGQIIGMYLAKFIFGLFGGKKKKNKRGGNPQRGQRR